MSKNSWFIYRFTISVLQVVAPMAYSFDRNIRIRSVWSLPTVGIQSSVWVAVDLIVVESSLFKVLRGSELWYNRYAKQP